ncbi:hypothetical protein HMPREF0793_0804 [Staphylococcus caprae M23864:W1]|nr:hypothetical protein HMPREF0793_0804 [Staphylococcus caprae M23864:W1]
MMNKINDRDIAELNSFWVYQDLNKKNRFKVNGKKFRQVDEFKDNINSNSQGASDAKTFELLNSHGKPSGQQIIVFQGTDNNESINPNNPLKGKVADDWIQNIKLMNNSNQSTELIKQNKEYISKHIQKIKDASKLSELEFVDKYGVNPNKYKNKSLINVGGNSQGAVGTINSSTQNHSIKGTTTNPARLPDGVLSKYKPSDFNNIINYHSNYDMLSWLQDPFTKNKTGKRVNLEDGVPTLEGFINSHLGYKRKFNKKDNTYKDIPVRKIKSVKDTVTKDGKKVSKTINIKLDMDGRIPINVWTGESIARSGSGKLIKLDIEKLGNLEQLVTGETSRMLSECVTFLNESFNISQKENSNFGNRKHKLKRDFIDKICLESMEGGCDAIKTKKHSLDESIDDITLKLAPITHLIPALNTIALKQVINVIALKLENGIMAIHDTIDDRLTKLFKNIDHDFHDGVAEEMMKHLKIVSKNITEIKNQNDIYGRQIGDIKDIMSQQDATIMDGNTNINYSGENMVSGTVQPSNYLNRKMTILKHHINNAIKDLSEYIQELYNDYFSSVFKAMEEAETLIIDIIVAVQIIITMLKEPTIQKVIKNLHLSSAPIENSLENFRNELINWQSLLHDLEASSPILRNHLDDIIMNTKPMIVNMIFEPSHYDDMFILNKAAQGRLDQMSQQFEVVCNGLNENDGQAIKTMDDSASLIRSNMNKVKNQLEKIAVY